ncbi:MAG: hypothetical protein KAQ92_07295, partial [Candidatus Aenigmarchaeota archaeon]|nr:hypothetical protein [Candidatus Aenigmarchaeota archaeon]
DENWSDYNCSWYINDTLKQVTKTDDVGTCIFDWNTTCSDIPYQYPLKVNLQNTTDVNFSIWSEGENFTKNIFLYANATIAIISPLNGSKYYYADGVLLNAEVYEEYCGVSGASYGVRWYYSDEDNENEYVKYTSYLQKQRAWTLNENYFYKEANLTAQLIYSYYNGDKNNVTNISIWRYAIMSNISSIDYPPKDTIINVTCSVLIDGLDDKSGYNISFYVNDANETISQTNSSGYADFEFNTTNKSGFNVLKCNITNDTNKYIDADVPLYLEKDIVIPSDLVLGDLFVENLAKYNPGTGWTYYNVNPVGNDDGNDDSKVVFRDQTTHWCEPQIIYFGANVTIPSPSGMQHIENAIVHFYIESNNF